MDDKKEVYNFIKKCHAYFIATYDHEAGRARVRPFSTFLMFEDKIYIQTGKKKAVSRQIAADPKVEISAMNGADEWIRMTATLVEDDRIEAQQAMLDSFPVLKKMYAAGDGNTQVFYLTDVNATISSFKASPKTYQF